MSTQVPADPPERARRSLGALSIGLIIVLVLALAVVVVVTRDDNDDTSDASVPATTPAPDPTAIETVPAITVPTTESTFVDTVPVIITEGQASVVAEGTTQTFGIPVMCQDFWAGTQITSQVLLDSVDHHVWVVDVIAFEEGGDRVMQAVDMDFAIAANVFGEDVAVPPTYSGNIDDDNQALGLTRATLQLTAGDGPASIDVTLGDTTLDDCAVGQISPQTPFAGTQVEWQSPDNTTGQRFNVLADCGGNLIVTGGGLLLTGYPQDGSTMSAGLVNTHNLTGDDVWWTNLVSPTPEETAFDEGGDGDINAAINAFPDGDRTAPPGYVSWTERPLRSIVGDTGLLDDICTEQP